MYPLPFMVNFFASISSVYFFLPLFYLKQIQGKLVRKEIFHGDVYIACHGLFCLFYSLP